LNPEHTQDTADRPRPYPPNEVRRTLGDGDADLTVPLATT